MGKKIVIELEVNNDAAIDDLNEVKQGFKKVIDEQQKQTKATEESTKATSELGDKLDGVTGGAVTRFKNLVGGIQSSTKSLKAMRVALIATGIGAFVVAIGTLVANLQNSEAGFNRVQKLLRQFGVIAGNVTDIFYSLGTAIFGLVTGDFELMNQAFDEAKERISNFGEETRKEIDQAGALSDKIAEANKRERELLVERARVNVEINKLKTKAAQVDKFTSEERIKFLEAAAALEDDITKKEVDLAKIRRDIKIEENSFSESTKEDLEEEAQLTANVIQLEEQRLMKNKEILGVAAGLRKADADKKAQERQAEIDAFAKQREQLDNVLDKSVKKQEKFEISKNANIASDLRDLQNYKNQLSEEERQTEENIKNAKQEFAFQALGAIRHLAGEGSAIGKAAAVTSATISGIEGVQNAYTTAQKSPITAVFPAYPLVQAGLAGAFSALQIKSILSTPKPQRGGGSPRGARAGISSQQAPSFNVVGAAAGNQLAEVIGGQQQQPVRAYVVSDDVSTQQALDRNIVETASIG